MYNDIINIFTVIFCAFMEYKISILTVYKRDYLPSFWVRDIMCSSTAFTDRQNSKAVFMIFVKNFTCKEMTDVSRRHRSKGIIQRL